VDFFRHSCENGNPGCLWASNPNWIPAFAGMTHFLLVQCRSFLKSRCSIKIHKKLLVKIFYFWITQWVTFRKDDQSAKKPNLFNAIKLIQSHLYATTG